MLFFTWILIMYLKTSVCICTICEDMFGGCKMLFSWLGQKVNKKIDALWSRDDTASRQDISIPFSLEYSNRIWSHWIFLFNFEISRIFDSLFHSNVIPESSVPHFIFRQFGDNVHFWFRQTVKKIVYGEGLARTQLIYTILNYYDIWRNMT